MVSIDGMVEVSLSHLLSACLVFAGFVSGIERSANVAARFSSPVEATKSIADDLSPVSTPSIPNDPAPWCEAGGHIVQGSPLKESDRANLLAARLKALGKVRQFSRRKIHRPARSSGSLLFWVRAASSSLNGMHIRLQI
jgi:hypothetical protein